MMNKALIFLSFTLLFFFHHSTTISGAQSPAQAPSQTQAQPAPAKAPTSTHPAVEPPSEVPLVQAPPRRARAAPTNVSKILEKAGGFSVFVRLLKSTSVSIQIENQLNVSNSLTIFAPTNGAFSALKPGTLNALSAEQKVQLVQYHILPQSVSLQNFQTLSNPVRTQASNIYDFPLNVTVEGRWVNISTGIVNATVSATIYDDNNQLAIYKLDKVLLPLGVFAPRPKPLAPAPASVKPSKEDPSTAAMDGPVAALDASGAAGLVAGSGITRVGVFVVVAMFFCQWSI